MAIVYDFAKLKKKFEEDVTVRAARETVLQRQNALGGNVPYAACVKLIRRSWAPHLSSTELAVLNFIADKSLAFGKWEERLQEHQFTHTVTTNDGFSCFVLPVEITRQAVYRALAVLKALNIVTVEDKEKHKLGRTYGFDFTKTAFDLVCTIAASKTLFNPDRVAKAENLLAAFARFNNIKFKHKIHNPSGTNR